MMMVETHWQPSHWTPVTQKQGSHTCSYYYKYILINNKSKMVLLSLHFPAPGTEVKFVGRDLIDKFPTQRVTTYNQVTDRARQCELTLRKFWLMWRKSIKTMISFQCLLWHSYSLSRLGWTMWPSIKAKLSSITYSFWLRTKVLSFLIFVKDQTSTVSTRTIPKYNSNKK